MNVDEILGFLWEVFQSFATRATTVFASIPGRVITELEKHTNTFNWLWASSPGSFFTWLVGFADVPLNVVNSVFLDLSLIPADAFIDAATARLVFPETQWTNRVLRGDQAVLMCVDIIATAGRRTAKLQLPNVFRVFNLIDGLKSRITTLTSRSPVAAWLKKIGGKVALTILNLYVLTVNLLVTGLTILIFASLVERVGGGIVEQYALQQKNPLVKDRRLGRKRSRV